MRNDMQDSRYTEWFRFTSQSMPEDKFHVVRFTGTEGLNTLFSFTIELVSSDLAVDTGALLSAPATFTILREGAPDAVFSGYPARVEQGGQFNGYAYYTVELRPAFWKLTQVVQSAIFLNQTVEEVTHSLLSGQEFFLIPHEFRLMRSYPSQEFAMQYEESIYDYILWRMEEQGAYFYFSPEGDKVIFADTPKSHDDSAATVFYSPTTGLENNHREEVISSFSLSQTPLPRQVVVRSYDWKNPRKLIVGEAEVSATGIGDVYLTHENVESDSEAERIAAIRAEELVCRSRIFTGTGSVPILRPGVTFTLDRHYNPAFNRDYLVTGITHEGGQETFLSLGLGIPMHNAKEHLFYHNTFSCIESDVPYRPERTAKRAKVSGVIRAFVDGAGSGARAEMDEYGRYKLLFPFDVSGRKQGNASCWIRMAQPQVGKDSGLSLPLLPGVEVIVSFIDGNPDRPVITGALPNGETGVITGSGNNNFSGIRTPGGNQITINDTDTHQGISLISASGNGLTMTSGSADSSTSTTDTQVSMASIGMAEVASVFKSTATGYKVTQSATCGKDWLTVTLPIVTKVLSSTGSILNSLSEKTSNAKTSEGLKWAGESSKLAGLLVSMGTSIKNNLTNKPCYGVTMKASNTASTSSVQAFPSPAELTTYIVSWFLTRAASLGLSITDTYNSEYTNKDKAEDAYTKALGTCMNDLVEADKNMFNAEYGENGTARSGMKTTPCSYYAQVYSAMSYIILQKNLSYGQTAGNGTDAAATASDFKAKISKWTEDQKTLETTWNVYCNSKDTNKKYYAYAKQDAIRKMSISELNSLLPELTAMIVLIMTTRTKAEDAGGITLNAADKNINLTAKTAISQHSDQGILLHSGPVRAYDSNRHAGSPMTMNDLVNEIHKDNQAEGGSKDASKWGIKGISGDFMSADLRDLMENEELRNRTLSPKALPYLALASDILYSKSLYKADFSNMYTFFGKDYLIRTGSKASTFRMTPEKISLENPEDDGTARISAASAYGSPVENTIGLSIEKDFISLNHKENSLVFLDEDWAAMKAKGSQVFLTKDTMAITGKTISIAGENDVSIKGNKVEVAGVVMQKGKIQGSNNGVLEIGGAIKVMASQVAASVKDAESAIKSALDKMNERIDALDKKLSADTTEDSAAKPE